MPSPSLPALILVAHGSRRPEATAALNGHCDALRQSGKWHAVLTAFVNAGDPAPGEAIDAAVESGARDAVIVPYFLDEVRSVRQDLPPVVAAARARHPQVRLRVTPVIGRHPDIPAAVRELAAEARTHAPGLVLAVHGSRDIAQAGGSPLVEQIRQGVADSGEYPGVRVGWLSGLHPSIGEAAESCLRDGAPGVICVPLFLLAGSHVCRDIPAIMDEVAARHSGAAFVVSQYLGASHRIPRIVADLAQAE